MVRPEDYLLLMFSMKEVGKRVDLKHVREKLSRDVREVRDEEAKKILDGMMKEGLIDEVKGLYGATEKGRKYFSGRMKEIEEELRKVNNPWVIVYKAKQYYPYVAKTIFEFCKGRYTGFYALFTEQRFFRRDFKGRKIVLKSAKDLMFFVSMHYIDVIPCVHRIGMDRPDWLVVDIDPGPKVDFKKTREVAEITYKIFERLRLNPALKFSGSRGFQVWSLIKNFEIPDGYQPLTLKGGGKRERNYFSVFADFVRLIQKEVDKEIPELTTSETLNKKEREGKILLDSSSMKPMGLVRSPYSIHSKTGLVSIPLSLKELREFSLSEATVEKTLERYRRKGNEFILKESDSFNLLELF